jgi:two-component system LytT family sensor kinase
LHVSIPILTVEPLVENAVKHGVAKNANGGVVRVEASVEGGSLRIRVCDTGGGFDETPDAGGTGVGLDNVIRRLRLCYGPDSGLVIESTSTGSVVGFRIPVAETEAAVR